MRTMFSNLICKVYGINNPKMRETWQPDIDDLLDGIQRLLLNIIKILVAITILMLTFGDSRLIDGAPLMWRIGYEWTHLLNNILFELLAGSTEGGFRR